MNEKYFNYKKINISDIHYNGTTKDICYNDKELYIIGSNMLLFNLIKNNSYSEPYTIDLVFRNDDDFLSFVKKIDNYIISILKKRGYNENKFVPSLRKSVEYPNENLLRILSTINCNIYDWDGNNYNCDKLDFYNSESEIECKPLFKVSLKTSGFFKYIEWELIQLKILNEPVLLVKCITDDIDEDF